MRRTRAAQASARQDRPGGRCSADRGVRATSGLNRLVVDPLVQARDLGDPAMAVGVLQIEDAIRRPVEVVGDERYLLVEPLEGVAADGS